MLSKEQIPSNLNIPQEGRLLIAFSGGSDSLTLMYLLSIVAHDRCEALYVNHKIRCTQELNKEMSLNERNASLLGVKLNVVELEEGEVFEYAKANKCGIEASCRALRYKKLDEYASEFGFDYILTAHHAQDQAETVLMRMLENSPFYTFQGILPQDGKLVRPMLSICKKEIEQILSYSSLSCSIDSTNSDTKYKRNFIRHRVIPSLSEESLELLVKIAANVYQYNQSKKKIVIKEYKHYVEIDRNDFLSSDVIARENAIYSASRYLENKERLSRQFLANVYAIAEKGSGKAHTKYLDFIATKNSIKIFLKVDDFSIPFSFSINSLGRFDILHEKIDEKVLSIDPGLLSGNVVLRKASRCDEIKLVEGTKRVRELEKRAHVPYSIVLEDENGIIAVFLRFLGARDRLSSRFISHFGKPIIIL